MIKLSNYKKALIVVILLSIALRWILVLSGGQYFFPDEGRYNKAIIAVRSIKSGDYLAAIDRLHDYAHYLFGYVALIPAALQETLFPGTHTPALFFSLFSVASLLILWGIMRRIGASEKMALIAVLFLSLSDTFFYYSRHLVPYDVSMTFGLCAIFVALRASESTKSAIACGLLAICCFMTYSGYWVLAAFAMFCQIINYNKPSSIPIYSIRLLITGIAFIGPLFIFFYLDHLFGGELFFAYRRFSMNVSQGLFSEGWILPFVYFWHAEHLILVFWIISFVYGLNLVVRKRISRTLLLGLLGIVFIYSILTLGSVVFERFVVYGRLARQLVPFFCIVSSVLFIDLLEWKLRRRYLHLVLFGLLFFQAAYNFSRPLVLVYPAEFIKTAREFQLLHPEGGVYTYNNARFIWPYPTPVNPNAKTMLMAKNPVEYKPYQYEGYNPDQRLKLRTEDTSMRLMLEESQHTASE